MKSLRKMNCLAPGSAPVSPAEMRSAEGRVGGHIGNHWESLGMIHAISSFPGRLKDKLGIGSSETF